MRFQRFARSEVRQRGAVKWGELWIRGARVPDSDGPDGARCLVVHSFDVALRERGLAPKLPRLNACRIANFAAWGRAEGLRFQV